MDIGVWEVDEATMAANPLEEAECAQTEALLEEVFVRNPTMLIPDVKLVGPAIAHRQRESGSVGCRCGWPTCRIRIEAGTSDAESRSAGA